MELIEGNKARVQAVWADVSKNSEVYRSEAVSRMFAAHPNTKTYFQPLDLSPGSSNLKAQGKKVIDALTKIINHLDNVPGAVSKLSDGKKLPFDPANFKLLGQSVEETIAAHHDAPREYTVNLSFEKFLPEASKVLFAQYG